MMRGLCYSAISYAQLFIDRTAAVVGCGDLALRAVAELAGVASHVTLVAPDCEHLDSPLGQKILDRDNVDVLMNYRVDAIKGDIYARSFVAVPVDGGQPPQEIEVDAIFVELDLLPRSDIVSHLIELDEKSHIKIDARCATSVPGIFAAGDVTDSYAEQVLIAIGEGAKAALSAYDYLLKQEKETIPIVSD